MCTLPTGRFTYQVAKNQDVRSQEPRRCLEGSATSKAIQSREAAKTLLTWCSKNVSTSWCNEIYEIPSISENRSIAPYCPLSFAIMPAQRKRQTGPSSKIIPSALVQRFSSPGKGPAKSIALVRAEDTRKREPPLLPANAAAVNRENQLNIVPPGYSMNWNRPWYLFDIVEPVAKFRHLGNGFSSLEGEVDVTEGSDSEDLTDHPGEDTKPVVVYTYP